MPELFSSLSLPRSAAPCQHLQPLLSRPPRAQDRSDPLLSSQARTVPAGPPAVPAQDAEASGALHPAAWCLRSFSSFLPQVLRYLPPHFPLYLQPLLYFQLPYFRPLYSRSLHPRLLCSQPQPLRLSLQSDPAEPLPALPQLRPHLPAHHPSHLPEH